MTDIIPAGDLPVVSPGATDSVVGVDESSGAARRFKLTNFGGVELGYATLAQLQAVTDLPTDTLRMVTNDPDSDNNGLWRWNGAAWVQAADRISALEQDSLGFRATLTASTLLEDYTENGAYFGSLASDFADAPTSNLAGSDSFTMEVLRPAGGTRWVYQTVRRFNSPDRAWVRRLDTQNGTATSWVQVSGNLAIGTAQLASEAVTEAKLGTGAVTANKIGSGAVTEAKIGTGAVTEGKIGAGAVTAGKIGAGAVTEAKIGSGAVTADKIGAAAVSRAKLANNFAYVQVVSTGSLNQNFNSGFYIVTPATVTDCPTGFTSGNAFLEVWGNGSFAVQRIMKRDDPNNRWVRDARPSDGVYNEWKFDGQTDDPPAAVTRFSGKRVVFLGDSITANYNVPDNVESSLGIVMHNFGIGGTRMGTHTADGYDQLSGFQIATAINDGDWSALEAGAATVGTQSIIDTVDAMAALDWSTVDYIVVGYGTNDFGGNRVVGALGDTTEDTFHGALHIMITQILTAQPHIRLLFWSPIWRRRTPTDTGGIVDGSDVSPNVNGTYLIEYVDALLEGCAAKHVEAVDLYRTSGIFELTNLTYLVDELHPTAAGADLLSAKIAAALQARF